MLRLGDLSSSFPCFLTFARNVAVPGAFTAQMKLYGPSSCLRLTAIVVHCELMRRCSTTVLLLRVPVLTSLPLIKNGYPTCTSVMGAMVIFGSPAAAAGVMGPSTRLSDARPIMQRRFISNAL